MSATPLHPMLERLVVSTGRAALAPADLDSYLNEAGDSVLFCGGDPVKYPECLDVAVVLPQLLVAFPGRLRVVVADGETAQVAQARYGFTRWPSLVFLRDGQYVGAISGMQDWPAFLSQVGPLLDKPVSRPPSVGIAVSAPASHCH